MRDREEKLREAREAPRRRRPTEKMWTSLPADKEKQAAFYRKMKKKEKGKAMSDADYLAIIEEVKTQGVEKRARDHYYFYANLEEEFPFQPKEAILALWKERVAKAEKRSRRAASSS